MDLAVQRKAEGKPAFWKLLAVQKLLKAKHFNAEDMATQGR